MKQIIGIFIGLLLSVSISGCRHGCRPQSNAELNEPHSGGLALSYSELDELKTFGNNKISELPTNDATKAMKLIAKAAGLVLDKTIEKACLGNEDPKCLENENKMMGKVRAVFADEARIKRAFADMAPIEVAEGILYSGIMNDVYLGYLANKEKFENFPTKELSLELKQRTMKLLQKDESGLRKVIDDFKRQSAALKKEYEGQ